MGGRTFWSLAERSGTPLPARAEGVRGGSAGQQNSRSVRLLRAWDAATPAGSSTNFFAAGRLWHPSCYGLGLARRAAAGWLASGLSIPRFPVTKRPRPEKTSRCGSAKATFSLCFPSVGPLGVPWQPSLGRAEGGQISARPGLLPNPLLLSPGHRSAPLVMPRAPSSLAKGGGCQLATRTLLATIACWVSRERPGLAAVPRTKAAL